MRDFVRELYENDIKFVGICFGHQMIAEALGGTCVKSDRGWGVGVHTVRIIQKKPWMRPPLESCNLIVSHLDQVCDVPEGAEVLGTNEHCPNSIFAVGKHFLGIQGHPEFTAAYADALVFSRLDRIGQSLVEEARKSLGTETHRETVTRWIENFFAGR